jgi:uncharacterized protein (DUF58 family)
VLTADQVRVLDGLTIGGSTASAAGVAGLRQARSRGAGVEFHEYRHYQPGDDPRSIDWTVEARLDQLVVRVSRAEGDLRMHVLVDISGSMSLGTPEKLPCASLIAAALAYVAIERRDAAGLATFDDRIRTFLPPSGGRAQLLRAFTVLRTLSASGRSSIDNVLLHYGAAVRGPGLVAIISDFFEPGAGLQGLRYLLHRGLTPAVIQVIAHDELQPGFSDDAVEIVDIENPGTRFAFNAAMVGEYRRRLEAHLGSLRAFCLTHRLPCVRIEPGTTFKGIVAQLELGGVVAPGV